MTRDDFCKKLWNYYLVLESDFIRVERYLSFDLGDNYLYDGNKVRNYGNSLAYSVELIKQYHAIGSEVDGILKVICAEIGNLEKEDMEDGYTPLILSNDYWKNLISQKVQMRESELQPFRNWSYKPMYKSPDWWSPHNRVKHNRINNSKKANLKNVANSLAGLYILEMYLAKFIGNRDKKKDVPDGRSNLFYMRNWETKYINLGDKLDFGDE